MGKLARLLDGIKEKLAGKKEQAEAGCSEYGKLDKTGSMRVEIRSRRARQLIAKNLAVADVIAGTTSTLRGGDKKKKKKRFFAF